MRSRIVIKVGTSTTTSEYLPQIITTINKLRQSYDVILVSSGAVAYGRKKLKLYTDLILSEKQAVASVGQSQMMNMYTQLFEPSSVGQVLISRSDFIMSGQYTNIKNTFDELLKMGIIPIVNENDTVNTSELRFGDNDTLAKYIAIMLNAQWVFFLTDVNGVYTNNPVKYPEAKHISVVQPGDQLQIDDTSISSQGTGGIQSKILAASMSQFAGIYAAIIPRDKSYSIFDIIQGRHEVGTHFPPCLETKQPVYGCIYINKLENRQNIYPKNIHRCSGIFLANSCVEIRSLDDQFIARGLTMYSSEELQQIQGKSCINEVLGYSDEDYVIHWSTIVYKN